MKVFSIQSNQNCNPKVNFGASANFCINRLNVTSSRSNGLGEKAVGRFRKNLDRTPIGLLPARILRALGVKPKANPAVSALEKGATAEIHMTETDFLREI